MRKPTLSEGSTFQAESSPPDHSKTRPRLNVLRFTALAVAGNMSTVHGHATIMRLAFKRCSTASTLYSAAVKVEKQLPVREIIAAFAVLQ